MTKQQILFNIIDEILESIENKRYHISPAYLCHMLRFETSIYYTDSDNLVKLFQCIFEPNECDENYKNIEYHGYWSIGYCDMDVNNIIHEFYDSWYDVRTTALLLFEEFILSEDLLKTL